MSFSCFFLSPAKMIHFLLFRTFLLVSRRTTQQKKTKQNVWVFSKKNCSKKRNYCRHTTHRTRLFAPVSWLNFVAFRHFFGIYLSFRMNNKRWGRKRGGKKKKDNRPNKKKQTNKKLKEENSKIISAPFVMEKVQSPSHFFSALLSLWNFVVLWGTAPDDLRVPTRQAKVKPTGWTSKTKLCTAETVETRRPLYSEKSFWSRRQTLTKIEEKSERWRVCKKKNHSSQVPYLFLSHLLLFSSWMCVRVDVSSCPPAIETPVDRILPPLPNAQWTTSLALTYTFTRSPYPRSVYSLSNSNSSRHMLMTFHLQILVHTLDSRLLNIHCY